MNPELMLVMPVYNEQASVRKVVSEWFQEIENWTEDFVFLAINDGSTDGTGDVLARLRQQLGERFEVVDQANQGHGQSCLNGYRLACERCVPHVFQIDSDGQCDPQYFFRFWRLREQFDVIYGRRVRRDDGTANVLPDPTAKLFRVCVRSLAREVASGKVILGAETRPMVKALNEVTGVPFTYLPHPVECDAAQAPDTGDSVGRLGDPSPQTPVSVDRQGDLSTAPPSVSVDRQGDLSTASPPVPATPSNHILFGCYGAARHEKGSDVLQVAIRLVLERDPEIPARFSFQWLGDFADAEGNAVKLDPWLKDHPKVEVIERYFEEGGYARQLVATDVMVLPYRDAYRLRVSRVVIEAMILGMPAVATRGTTLSSQLSEYGIGRGCDDGSVDSLATAICEVAKEFARLAAEARVKAGKSEDHFSVKNFRKTLLIHLSKRLAA